MDVGQKVKVSRIRYRKTEELTAAVAEKIGQVGTIEDYKMTDGSGIGYKLAFDDNSSSWYFENEVESV